MLLHDTPVVYVSDELPNMKDVASHPTRPLDSFETRAVLELKDGAELSMEPNGKELRMLGAIRNLTQCIVCHEGSRGDLLGAFTYNLKPIRFASK